MMKVKSELPLRMLEKIAGNNILVKLKDGTEYMGILESSDISMNLILSDARQVTERNEMLANYGRILIRGSNILYISIDPDRISFYE